MTSAKIQEPYILFYMWSCSFLRECKKCEWGRWSTRDGRAPVAGGKHDHNSSYMYAKMVICVLSSYGALLEPALKVPGGEKGAWEAYDSTKQRGK